MAGLGRCDPPAPPADWRWFGISTPARRGLSEEFRIDRWPLAGQVAGMSELRISSVADQVADYLRGQILSGRWSGTMPGRHELAAELGINHKTAEAALRLLEGQGLLLRQGAGRGRRQGRSETGCWDDATAVSSRVSGYPPRPIRPPVRRRFASSGTKLKSPFWPAFRSRHSGSAT